MSPIRAFFCPLLALGLITAAALPAAKPPALDPNRIINESYGFMKNREPEMTDIEHALYERVVAIAGTRPDFALKMLETMLADKEPESPAFEYVLANIYYTNKQYDLSEQRYRAAITKYPEYLRAWTNLGVLYYATQRYAEAVPCFTKAIQLGDSEASTYGLLAYSLDQIGNSVPAEICYMQAIAAEPDNVDWIGGLLGLYLAQKQYGPAESLVRRLIVAKPGDPNHWLVYANLKIALAQKVEAIAALETALQAGDPSEEVLLLLGDLYAERNMPADASRVYQRIITKAPEVGVRRLLSYAEALIDQGNGPEAARILNGLTGELPPTERLALRRVQIDLALSREDWDGARQALEDYMREAPLDGTSLISLAQVYKQLGDPGRSEFALQQAAQIEASAYRANVELANLRVTQRKYSEALELLQRALELKRSPALEDYILRVRSLLPPAAAPTP